MERIKGLYDLIRSDGYRKALGLPEQVTEEYSLLAQGEYNVNYRFIHPVSGRKLLLRVNCGSQMHLDNQIEYEYRALKMLEASGRTPEVFYVDGSRQYLDHGILVMEELPGQALDYNTDLGRAAAILADIHSTPVSPDMIPQEGDDSGARSLICPADPLGAILDESEQMAAKYFGSPLADKRTGALIRELLDLAWEYKRKNDMAAAPYRCCINTELNSTNFLINRDGDRDHLIDWEKPLYGDPAQDLGHFLAPTTTFWKTDVILGKEDRQKFIDTYTACVGNRFDTTGIRERTELFTAVTCLRGITWCAMAWVEYRDPARTLTNASTAAKLDQYLEEGFLMEIKTMLD